MKSLIRFPGRYSLGIILLLAGVFRITLLDRIPTAITGDELLYVVTAKSIALTGRDLSSTWNPLSVFLYHYPKGELQAELPYFIHLVSAYFLPFSLVTAKIPFALLSIGIVLLLYLVSKKLFGDLVAIITGLIASLNPWLIVMGRTAYETTPATFFYLLGTYFLLSGRYWSFAGSIISFIFAFYSYIGTKVIFIPYIFLSSILAYRNGSKTAKQLIFLCGFCLLFTATYVILINSNTSGSRLSELFLTTDKGLGAIVDSVRKNSIQSPLLPLMTNKFTVYFQIVISKLFGIFSPSYLFVTGDQFFLPVAHGFFYITDGLFLLLGLVTLFKKNTHILVIMLAFTLLGTLPHIFHKTMTDFSAHIALIFPFLIFFIAFGIAEVIRSTSIKYRGFLIILIACIYVIQVVGFIGVYVFQYPLVGASDFSLRILSKYLQLSQHGNNKLIVYSTRSPDVLKKYLFYSNSMNTRTLNDLRELDTSSDFIYNGITFSPCDNDRTATDPNTTYIVDAQCDDISGDKRIRISRLSDGGGLYFIVNDSVCGEYSLHNYPQDVKMNDFSVESLPSERFCSIYINK